jgi:hypothetical protein
MGRTIIIGDVHGCRRELEDLLSYIGYNRGDRLVFVGDLVVRGPDPRGTLELIRKLRAESVRGNHEDRLLRWRRGSKKAPVKIGPVTKATATQLKEKDWEYLEDLPLWIDIAEHGIRVVHAGVVPGLPIEEQDPRAVMYLRTLTRAAPGWPLEASEDRGRSWAHSHPGPEHIVFGHNAQPEPEIAVHATGIDTGAVYGGRLSAMVLRPGEEIPPPSDRRSIIVSVPSRRAYVTRSLG